MTTPTPVIAGAWRIAIRQRYLGQPVTNVFGFLANVGSQVTPGVATGLAQQHADAWRNHVLPALSNALTLEGALVYSLQDDTVAGQANLTATGGQAAATNGGAVTSAICANTRLSTGRRGRRFQGRTGLAGLNEADIDGNSLTPAAVSRLELALSGWTTQVNSGNQTVPGLLCVISEVAPGFATPVTRTGVSTRIGTRVARLR